MRKEEDEVLPLAAEALTPRTGTRSTRRSRRTTIPSSACPASKAFRELFRRIVALVPPPFGVGPEPPARK